MKNILWGLLILMAFAGFIFQVPAGAKVFLWVNEGVVKILIAGMEGARFLFGPLANPPGEKASIGFILAFQAFPTIIFFAALMEILYHWALDASGLVVTVRTHVDRNQPEIASIVAICPAAEWIEREMWELLGISVQDHPDLRHLLLQDDWPQGKYPLRRDYRKD